MTFPLPPERFDELLAFLPAAEAVRIRGMDRTAYETHVAAYLALRRTREQVPHALRVALVGALFAYHDRVAEGLASL